MVDEWIEQNVSILKTELIDVSNTPLVNKSDTPKCKLKFRLNVTRIEKRVCKMNSIFAASCCSHFKNPISN